MLLFFFISICIYMNFTLSFITMNDCNKQLLLNTLFLVFAYIIKCGIEN